MSDLRIAGSRAIDVSSTSGGERSCASILMVDDQPARLLTYEAMLSGLGVDCVRALSGMDALEKLLKQEFAVILLDVHMPGMDGFEVARAVREHPRMERTPIIFVTGVHSSELDRLRGYELGAIDYISVPVVPEILRSKVAVLVELYGRRNELQSLNRELQEMRERIEAEHAKTLADKEAELLAAFENHPDELTVMMKPHRNEHGAVDDWIYLNANGNALKLLGKTRESLIGRTVSEVLGERGQLAIERCTEVHSSGKPLRYEAQIGDADMMITMFPAGREMVISSAIDVTERKRATTALRETERRNRALLENAPVGIAHDAMDGRFEYVNAAFCEIVGYSADELCGMTWQQITHPDDVEMDATLRERSLAGEIPHYTLEKRYVRKDGSTVWVNLFRNIVRDDGGAPLQGVAVAIDVTRRKQAERALRESQERLVIAKTAARIGIYDWDIQANVIRWDERVCELWGFEPSKPVTLEAALSAVHPDDKSHLQQAIDRALDPSGDGTFSAIYRVVNRRDGKVRWIEAHGQRGRENGLTKRLNGTVQDITARKLVEKKLQDNDRRKDEFLAMLAHELRNPIAPIRNAAEVLNRLVGDAQARSLVSMIQRQGAHLSRMLDDLLDAARITQGRIELRLEVLSVAGCIEHALEAVQPQVNANHLDLAFTRTAQPLYVHADRVRLEQCIGNLLSNAVKYSQPHGAVRVRLFSEGRDAVIEVQDFGVGIAPEFAPSMFELFAQGERALDRAEGGLGVGLSVCKQLIEMHGGSVAGFSEGLGRGATFTLRIPLQSRPERSRAPDMLDAEPARRVLIVDDNHDAADSLAICLQLEGHETKAVYSAEGALAEVHAFHPEVVLLDIGLPSMDGYQVARCIRSTNSTIRVIALTGYGQDEDKQRAIAAGFDAHFVKPVDIAALRTTLSNP